MDEERDLCYRCQRDYDLGPCPLDDDNLTKLFIDGPIVACMEFEPRRT